MATRLSPYRKVQPATVERRDALRHPVTLTSATAREMGEPPVAAVLQDLSTFGCRLSCDAAPVEGTRLWLRLSGSMPIAATVVRSGDGEAACRFDRPIDRQLVRSLTIELH